MLLEPRNHLGTETQRKSSCVAGASVMKEEVQPRWDASFSGDRGRDVQGSLLLPPSSLPSGYPTG